MRYAIILLTAALTGCAAVPHTMRASVEHLSHPAVGRPFDDSTNSEDWLDQVTVSANWQGRGWYWNQASATTCGGGTGRGSTDRKRRGS